MEKNQKSKRKSLKKPKVVDIDGLKIDYEKEEFEKQFPHLMSEVSTKKKIIKIDSVNINLEGKENMRQLKRIKDYEEDLKNPGVLDFIRRCKNNEEVFEILEYLFKRREIDPKFYKNLKGRIKKKGGLKKLIQECGGQKEPGYYERKYYSKKV